jgi:hypothetical protein
MDIQPPVNEKNQEHTPQTQSQAINSTEAFLYGFLSSAAGHFINDTCLKSICNKPVTAVCVYYRSNLLQSSLYIELTDQWCILSTAPLCLHLKMNYWLHRSLQSSAKLYDEHIFQYHNYGVSPHFRGTDIITLRTMAVKRWTFKKPIYRKSSLGRSRQTISNTCKIYQLENCRRTPGEILWIQTRNDNTLWQVLCFKMAY